MISTLPCDPHERLLAFDAFKTLVTYDSAPNGGALHFLLRAAKIPFSDRHKRMKLLLKSPIKVSSFRTVFDNIPSYARISDTDRATFINLYNAELTSICFYDDAPNALLDLDQHGERCTIISNLGADFGEALGNLIERHKLSHILNLQTSTLSYEIKDIKPTARMFEHAAHSHACDVSNILMIGNHLKNDILAARNAGAHGLQIIRNGEKERADTNTIITTLSEVATLLPT